MARLDIASINSTPRFILTSGKGRGSGIHLVRARLEARLGAIINTEIDEIDGHSVSLINNLTVSAMGCNNP